MTSRSFGTRAVILSLAAVTAAAAGFRGGSGERERKPARKPAFRPNIGEVIHETQKVTDDADRLTLVWWTPTEFWVLSARQAPGAPVTEAQVQELKGMVQKYVVVAVMSAKMGPFGGMRFSPAAKIRSSLTILDRDGRAYRPLAEEKLDPDTKNLFAMMGPVLANVAGQAGKNIHFFFFPGTDVKGRPIADPKRSGAMIAKFGKERFRWRLPLGSLLPKKMCPNRKCKETLNGAFNYCPWCGRKLLKTEPATKPVS